MRNVHIVYMDTHNGQVYLFFIFQFLLFSVCIISFCYSVLCMVLFQLSSKFGFIISSKWYLNLFSKKIIMKVVKKYPSSFSLMSMTAEFILYYRSLLEVPLIFFFMHPSQVFIDLVHLKSLYLWNCNLSISEIVIGLLEIKKFK